MSERPKCFTDCGYHRGHNCIGDVDKLGNVDPMCQFCLRLCSQCEKDRWLRFLMEFGPSKR